MAIRSDRPVSRVAVAFAIAVSSLASVTLSRIALAAPIKVVGIGEQTTVSCEVALTKEWPAQLQTILGASYNVVNDGGDTQGTVLPQASYCKAGIGADPYANTANKCTVAANCPSGCYSDSINAPDVVIIGPFGEHDYRVVSACMGTVPAVATQATFQAAYEALVQDYLTLKPKPLVIVTTPLLIPSFDAGTAAYVKNVIDPAVRAVAKNDGLPLVDLYATFMPQSATGMYFMGQGDGQVNPAGETEIAKLLAAVIEANDGGAMGAPDASADTGVASGSSSGTATSGSGSSTGTASGATSGGSGSVASGTASGTAQGTSGSTSGTAASGTIAPTSGTATSGDMGQTSGAGTSGTAAGSSGSGSGTATETTAPKSTSGCAFSAAQGSSGGAAFALLGLGLFGIVRRRRSS